MTDALPPARRPGAADAGRRRLRRRREGRHAKRSRRSRRWLFLLIPVGLLAFCIVWIGVRGLLAKADLERAQAAVATLKSQVAGMDLSQVSHTYATVSADSASARQLTDDPIWRAGELVPVLGRNLTVVRQLAGLTDDVVTAVEPVVGLSRTLSPASLTPKDGAIPLDPISAAGPVLHRAAVDIGGLSAQVDQIDASGTISQVSAARARLSGLLQGIVPELKDADTVVSLTPTLLGADGPRTYVVMFQNNAELRSLGGTALSFAVISLDHGKITLIKTVAAGSGDFPDFPDPVIPIPDGFDQIYPKALGHFIANATLRPSFSTAAEIVDQNWKRQFGVNIDGVVSLDGVALSYILNATGPISLSSGDTIDARNVVAILLNSIYQRFNSGNYPVDNQHEDALYTEAISQTFTRLSSGAFDPGKLLSGLVSGLNDQRILFWDAHGTEQAALSATPMFQDGLPPSSATTDGVGIYFNDYVGSKLNYYLRSAVTTASGVCESNGRQSRRFTVALSSALSPTDAPNLSTSIAGGLYKGFGLARGAQRLMLFFYAPPGAAVVSAQVDGKAVEVTALHDQDRPVERIVVTIDPGAASTVVVDMLMAPGTRSLSLRVTPTLAGTPVTAAPLDCSTVAPSK